MSFKRYWQQSVIQIPIYLLALAPISQLTAEESESNFTLETHKDGANELALEQDDLSADVQDLIDEQTDSKIIEMLREVEVIMADAIDLLEEEQTGGATIATETEVIEKIFDAAKQKQQSSQSSESSQENMGSMLQMMENMMNGGKDLGDQKSKNQQAGNGGGGNSSGQADGTAGAPDTTAENNERRVPKNAGITGQTLPKEFQKAMEAYNRGALKPKQIK